MSFDRKPVRNLGNDMTPNASLIDKLGIGGEVLRLRKAGCTQQEIAKQLNLNPNTVNQWLSRHQALPEESRQAVADRNIFQIAERLQENFAELYRSLEDARNSGDLDSRVKVLAEIRQYLRFAGDLVEKLETMKQNEKFKQAFLEWLDEQAPGAQVAIIRKLQQNRDYFSIIRPL